jgi:competence protein ComEC
LRRRGIDIRLAVVAAVLWAVQAFITVLAGSDNDYERAESMAPVEWQQAFAEALSGLPGDGAALLPGLTLGDTSAVDHGLNSAMRVASLTHLTAVSGANCAIVTVAVMGLAALIGLPRWARVVVGILALAGFVLVVGLQPSVVRAAMMATVVLVAIALGRSGAGIPVVAFAVCVLLLVFPEWSVSPGFTLSVAATVAILVLAPVLARRFVVGFERVAPHTWVARLSPTARRNLGLILAVPVSTQLVCQPIIMLFAPVWPTYGVLANILAEPAAPLATILGMVAFVLAPVVPWLAHAVAWLGWVPSAWIAVVAQTAAHMPLASLPWFDGLTGAACAAVTSVFICFVIVARRRRLRTVGALGTALTLGLAFAVALSHVVGVAVTRPVDWRIAMCDVGQGDALVVRGFDNQGRPRDILIDTGRHADLTESCLQNLGITRIEAVVLTHFDADHAGGIEAVYERTEHVLISAPQRESDDAVIRGLVAQGITVTRATSGQRVALGDTTCTVLWPAPGHPSMQGGNPGSISLSVAAPGLSAIFLADLDEESQNALLAQHPGLGRVDVLKVAHHGSSDQSARLTNVLRPRVALISAGRDNGYGHPTGKTMRLLESIGARSVRTDISGLALISSSPDDLRVWSARGGGGAG